MKLNDLKNSEYAQDELNDVNELVGNGDLYFDRFTIRSGCLDTDQQRLRIENVLIVIVWVLLLYVFVMMKVVFNVVEGVENE